MEAVSVLRLLGVSCGVIIGDWRHAYHHDRPHSSMHYQASASYAATCTHYPQLS
jgi:hypothetical protein